jgi:hypothetical protein
VGRVWLPETKKTGFLFLLSAIPCIPKIRSSPNFRFKFQIPYPRISHASLSLAAPIALTVVAVVRCAGVMGESYGRAVDGRDGDAAVAAPTLIAVPEGLPHAGL